MAERRARPGAPDPHDLGGAVHTADTLANLNSKVSDATLDDTGTARTPTVHALGGAEHSADTLANLNSKVSDATLADEADHLKLAGRAGGQTANGGTAGGDELKLRGTAASAAGGFDISSALTIQRALMEPDADLGRNLGSAGAGNKRYNRLHIKDIELRKALADAQPVLKLRDDGTNGILEAGLGGAAVVDIRLIRLAAKKWSIENPAAGVGATLRLGGTGTEGVLELIDTPDVAASAVDEGKIRYNKTTQKIEFSENGVAFAAPGGAGTFDETYNASGVNPTITVDNGEVIWTIDGGPLPALSVDTVTVWANSSGAGDNVNVSIISGTSGKCRLHFGTSADENPAIIEFNHTGGLMRFFVKAAGFQILELGDALGVVINDAGEASIDLRVEGESLQRLLATDASAATENVILLHDTAPDVKTMDRGVAFGNVSQAPTGDPVGGGFLYVLAGALTWRGSSGNITTIAIA